MPCESRKSIYNSDDLLPLLRTTTVKGVVAVKILIVDEHAVVRAGTRMILQETGNEFTCDEAPGCCEALLMVQSNNYDMVLLGLTLSGHGGFDVLARIKQLKPNLPIVVVNMHSEEQYAVKAYSLGADGYIGAENTPEDLVVAIKKVVRGGKYISEHLMEEVLTGLCIRNSPEQPSSNTKPLSKREKQVAELLVSGATNKEIAWQLSLSIKTVSTYKTRILDKLSLKSLAELVKYQLSLEGGNTPAASAGAPSRHRSD
jgi:two-component system invasion response regulator UvrY